MRRHRTPAQWYALLAGAFLVALGLLTVVFGGVQSGATGQTEPVLLWQTGGWDAALWLAVGGLGVFASTRLEGARTFGMFAAALLGIAAVWGFFDLGVATLGLFALGTSANVTHAILAVLGFAAAAVPPVRLRRRTGRRSPTAV